MARPRKQSCVENHGDNPPRDKGGNCRQCQREYRRRRRAAGVRDSRGDRPAARKRDKARKRAAVAAYRNARGCLRCGSTENLHLHHRDPSTKLAEVSALIDRRAGWQKIWAEVAKCIVLCSRCHTEHHWPAAERASRHEAATARRRATRSREHTPTAASAAAPDPTTNTTNTKDDAMISTADERPLFGQSPCRTFGGDGIFGDTDEARAATAATGGSPSGDSSPCGLAAAPAAESEA